jgi:hypothetical protein
MFNANFRNSPPVKVSSYMLRQLTILAVPRGKSRPLIRFRFQLVREENRNVGFDDRSQLHFIARGVEF